MCIRDRTAVDHSFIFDKQTGKFTTPSGIIQHMTLGITEIKSFHAADEYKYWDIAAYTSPILEHEKAYYLYLKCDKNGTTDVYKRQHYEYNEVTLDHEPTAKEVQQITGK